MPRSVQCKGCLFLPRTGSYQIIHLPCIYITSVWTSEIWSPSRRNEVCGGRHPLAGLFRQRLAGQGRAYSCQLIYPESPHALY